MTVYQRIVSRQTDHRHRKMTDDQKTNRRETDEREPTDGQIKRETDRQSDQNYRLDDDRGTNLKRDRQTIGPKLPTRQPEGGRVGAERKEQALNNDQMRFIRHKKGAMCK